MITRERTIFLLLAVMFFASQLYSQSYVGLDMPRIVQVQSNWCWVACAEMVFRHYGHPISQARMVTAVYGSPVNMPSMNGINFSSLFARIWEDDNGHRFRSEVTSVYDFLAGASLTNNSIILNELGQQHPIVIGVGGHAVVMEGAIFFPPYNIIAARIVDPWPEAPPVRDISGTEIVPANFGGRLIYICTIRVTDIN